VIKSQKGKDEGCRGRQADGQLCEAPQFSISVPIGGYGSEAPFQMSLTFSIDAAEPPSLHLNSMIGRS
jgi:hypothetical protein